VSDKLIKFQIVKEEFRRLSLLNYALMSRNALHIVGPVARGVLVPLAAIRQEAVIKSQIVKAEFHRLQLLNLVLMSQLVRQTLGNVAIGELVHHKAFKLEAVAELMIALPQKPPPQRRRNIAKRRISPNYNHRQKI